VPYGDAMPATRPLTVRVDAELMARIDAVGRRLAAHESVARLGKLTTQQTLMWLIHAGLDVADDRLGTTGDDVASDAGAEG